MTARPQATRRRLAPLSPSLHQPWKPDLASLPASTRRLGRYVLSSHDMNAFCLLDDEVTKAAWSLLYPLFDPSGLEQIMANWQNFPDSHAGEDDNDVVELSANLPPEALLSQNLRYPRYRRVAARLLVRLDLGDLAARLQALDDQQPTHPTVRVLAESLGLGRAETCLLDFVEKRGADDGLRTLLREFSSTDLASNLGRLAGLVGLPVDELRPALNARGSLRQLDFVKLRQGMCDLEDFVAPSDFLVELLHTAPADPEALSAYLLDPCPNGEWSLTDFPHLAGAAARSLPVLTQAARQGEVGVNALLYGPPGSGKTEFAKALAAAAGLRCYKVKTQDENGDPLSRTGRLSAWRLAQRLVAQQRQVALIFDEAEDVFQRQAGNFRLSLFDSDDGASSQDKGWMNEMLESNPVPTLWISNRVAHVDRAFLRRFLMPIAFHTPPRSVRQAMVARHLGDLDFSPALIARLADDEQLTPGQLASASRVAKLLPDDSPEVVEALVRDSLAASRILLHGAPHARRRRQGLEADLAFLNLGGMFTPAQIVTALHTQGRGSLLCYGPSGTGKTTFAELLAQALDRELIVRHASDLLGPYVGQNEENIAAMFRSADPQRSMLLLDEADSFLRDRRTARQGWEATQVNELLQQMERFDGVFLCATNLFAHIDPAALRRFDFAIEFRPLNAAQRLALFAREVHAGATGAIAAGHRLRLNDLSRLTPGDFTAVCRQFDLLGLPRQAERILERLEETHRLKRQLET